MLEEKPDPKTFWFREILLAKQNQTKDFLSVALEPDLLKKLSSDKLDKDGVFTVIKALFHDSQNLWSSEQILQAWGKTRSVKSNKNSDCHREKGNQNVKLENWTKALTCYNEALIWAENNSLQLTQAIANRAFVWLKLEKFSLALSDLEKVLSFENYPKNSLFKIYQRLATVFQNLGQSRKSVENFTKAIKLIDDSNLSKEQKGIFKEGIRNDIKSVQKMPEKFNRESCGDESNSEHTGLYVNKEHEEMPNVTNKLEVKYSDQKGRYSIAKEIIYPGEVIIRTKAIASMIKITNTKLICYNCLIYTLSPVPCGRCAAVVFCSTNCYNIAIERHAFDCHLSFMDVFLTHGNLGAGMIPSIFLAMKMLTTKPAQFFIDNCHHFSQVDETKIPVSKEGFDGLDNIFNSVTHLNTTQNQFQKILTALFLYQCLNLSTYFNDICNTEALTSFHDERNKSEVYFTSLIFHFMLAGASNNHGVAAMTSEDHKNQHGKKLKIATAIFPGTASLLNHSCNPNTSSLIQQDFQIIYAAKTIQQGEEITDIYKSHFCETPLEIRQKGILDSYHFKCTCTACVENYATFNELPEDNFNDSDYDESHRNAMIAFNALEYKEAAVHLAKSITIIGEKLAEPNKLMLKNRISFIDCVEKYYGNKMYLPK